MCYRVAVRFGGVARPIKSNRKTRDGEERSGLRESEVSLPKDVRSENILKGPARECAANPPGFVSSMLSTGSGGVAALDHRLMAVTPSGYGQPVSG